MIAYDEIWRDTGKAKGNRSVTAEELLERYCSLMPKLGVTRLANITGLDSIGLPVVAAIRPQSRSLAVSIGKGRTLAEAKLSALMESCEGWHAERLNLPIICQARREFADPERDALPLTGRYVTAPHRVHDHVALLWVQGFDLETSRDCWAPYDLVTLNFVYPPGTRPCFQSSSNGLGAGATFGEAVLQGLTELVERDAIACWGKLSADQKKAVQVDPETLPDGPARDLLQRVRAVSAEIAIWDITSDIGVPGFAVTLLDGNPESGLPLVGAFMGYGAATCPNRAVMRALSEAVQSRLSLISGSRDDLGPWEYQRCRRPDELIAMLTEIQRPAPTRSFQATASIATDQVASDLRAILGRVQKHRGGRVVAFDLSRPEIGIPVARVIATNLSGMPRWTSEHLNEGTGKTQVRST
ncbi:MAG: YcaO-like family protein [Rhodocyclaceae bacterium]|nr:YcaO-like family protein [Rhodocyclaceae bacterium]